MDKENFEKIEGQEGKYKKVETKIEQPQKAEITDAMILDILKIPDELKQFESKLIALVSKKIELEKQIKGIESVIYIEVNSEKNADGKAVFTNEKSRDIEVQRRLSNNFESNDNALLIKGVDFSIQETKTEIDFLSRKLKVYSMMFEALKIKYKM